MNTKYHPNTRAGFTLAEILLAMLVFAIAITTILALLARSIETADEILLKDEAINLSSALDSYMSELPFYDGSNISAYSLVQRSDKGGVYTYQYRGQPGTDRGDGTLLPYTSLDANSVVGQDYVTTPGIRDPVDEVDELDEELVARSGRLFYVKLSESPANPFTIQNGSGNLPSNPNAAGAGGFPVYDSAVLVIFAEFFVVPTKFESGPLATFISNSEPVFSFNFAVRR